MRSGAEEITLTSDREAVQVSLSSLKAFPQQPYPAVLLWKKLKAALPYLDQEVQLYLANNLVAETRRGQWKIRRWGDFLRLAWKALRS